MYTYSVYDDNDYQFDCYTTWEGPEDLDRIAEGAAKDYYDEHDGWEAAWPINIRIYHYGNFIKEFIVDLEFEPTFGASEVIPEGE